MKNELPIVNKTKTIKETMRIIDKGAIGTAFIVDAENKFIGLVTDGNIRRALLEGINMETSVEKITNKDCIVFHTYWTNEELKEFMNSEKVINKLSEESILKIPLLDEEGHIKDIEYLTRRSQQRRELNNRKPILISDKIKSINKVLVVGGAGYLGSVLTRKLLQKGYKVRILDNLSFGDDGIKELYSNKNFEFVNGDIRNISNIVESIKGIDAVIHLAAIVGDPACAADPRETLEINYLATKMIAETCKYFQVNRFLFASTCSVYGESSTPDAKLTENSPLNPISLYAETKINCEKLLLELKDDNFSPLLLRMGTLYGYSPNMRFDLVVNLLIAKAIFDKKITIFGGEQWRPFLHVEDAADIYIRYLEIPIEKLKTNIFNIVSENCKIVDIGKIIKSICPEAQLEINNQIIDKRNYNVSFNKMSNTLNYKPKNKISEGIIEIKNVIEKGIIKDYKDAKYRTH